MFQERPVNKPMTPSAALAVGIVLFSGPALAAEDISSAPQSLTRTHAAQFNVTAEDGPVDSLAEPCKADLRFVDENGRTFMGANGQLVATRVSLLPGQTRSLALPAGVAFLDGTQKSRAIFRARLKLANPPVDSTRIDPCEGILAAVEVFDSRSGESLQLQLVMDRKHKAITTISNILKNIHGTVQSILDNLS